MRLPPRERVIYARNPLIEVICQARFPRNLELEARLPVDFQRHVRDDYPIFRTREEVSVQLGNDSIHREQEGASINRSRVFDFVSTNEEWFISLSSGFVALTTSNYEQWEGFREKFRRALETSLQIYSVKIVTRLGLRYKNLVARSALGLDGTPWNELLTPHIAGFLASGDVDEGEVLTHQVSTRLTLDSGIAILNHGLVRHTETGEVGYLIDGDFFLENKLEASSDGILSRLDTFNAHAGDLFRWCISDRLHQALDPRPLG
jgi:uncharacterized protein (TIGR04255 family)